MTEHSAEAESASGQPVSDRTDGLTEPLTGPSRKMGRAWSRLQPGLEGRLISFGGIDDDAWAWIDVRPEKIT